MSQSPWFFAALAALLFTDAAYADDYIITIKDHQFSPKELVIPANRKIKLLVKNTDTTPAEFESYDFNREKVVDANNEITVFVGPLKPGKYAYFDDFHKDTTTGSLIVK